MVCRHLRTSRFPNDILLAAKFAYGSYQPVRFRLSKVAPLLFCSGACALVYQVAWLRELRLVFGASTAASAAVLAVFMGGLGLGGLLLGRRADKVPNPLLFYANLEIFIAIASGITPALVWLARGAYLALGGQSTLGIVGATIARILLGALVLIVPTTLMGGTMPAAARAVSDENDPGRRSMSVLYGVNTLGAVLGALAANFAMLEVFGTRLTVWMTCLVNLLIALVARMLSRDALAEVDTKQVLKPAVVDPAGSESPDPTATVAGADDPTETLPAPSERTPESSEPESDGGAVLPPAIAWFPIAASAVVGFAFLLMELVWYRMLGPLLGGSSYTFGLILAVALLGIGIGGAVYGTGKAVPTLRGLAMTCGLEALLIALPYAAGDRIALLALALRPLRILGFGGSVASWAVVCLVVVFPAAVVSGVQFPLVIGLFGRGGQNIGKHIGVAYLANTVGAIVGSLSGGFGLLPALTAPGCWRLVVTLLAAFGTVALFLSARHEGRRGPVFAGALGTIVLSLLAFVAEGPTAAWRHSPIGAGRLDALLSTPTANEVDQWRHDAVGSVLWERDGLESTVAAGRKYGTSFIVNGKTDGNAIGDAPTQIMSGLLGTLLHPAAKRALVVGLGTGSTAGWLARVTTMDHVDVVELEPAVVSFAKECAAINEHVLENPKVNLILGDAREVLLTSRERYDVVFSEPSNPYRAGVSSLYTREYYTAARSALAPGGIFIQWMQAYEVDADALHTVLRTVGTVFPHVELWETMPGDFLVLGFPTPPGPLDIAKLRERLGEEPYKTAVRYVWGGTTPETVLSHFVATPAFVARLAEHDVGAVNVDDLNRLEFSYARSVGQHGTLANETARLSRALGTDRPAVVGDVRWDRVDDSWVLFRKLNDNPVPFPRPVAPSRSAEGNALRSAYANFDRGVGTDVLRSFSEAHVEPTYFEEVELARVAARSPIDPHLAEASVARLNRATAELILAEHASRGRDVPQAVAHLLAGFRLAATDIWVDRRSVRVAFGIARELVEHSGVPADVFLEVLAKPFVLYLDDASRLDTAIWLAARTGSCTVISDIPPLAFPWEVEALRSRVECYTRAGSPALGAARADLARFARQAPMPVGGR